MTNPFQAVVARLLLALVLLAGWASTAVSATLGNTAVGTGTDNGDSNYINGSRFTMPSTGGTVSSISVYVASVGASPANKYQLAIYSDNAGKPAALLAASGTGTLTANAWNTLPIAASLQAGAAYWLLYNTNGTSSSLNNMKYGSGGTDAYSQGATAFGSWPTSFGASVIGNLMFSIYATYTPSVADTSAPSAPGSLSATGGAGSASLAWGAATDNVGVTGYSVYRATISGFTPAPANMVGSTTGTSYTDSGLAANAYYYLVTASDAAGNVGPPSNQATAAVTTGTDPRATVGQWASPVGLPNVMQHAILLPSSSRILYFESGSGTRVLDPLTGTLTGVPLSANLFCAGQTLLADGRPITIGGDTESMGTGLVDSYRFDPSTNGWTRLADMAYKRWYPTATRLPDGRILAMSGSSDGCTSCFVQIPEVYDPVANTWTQLTSAAANIDYYPFMYVLPDGRLVQAGASEQPTTTRVLDLRTQTWSTVDARVIDGGSSAMYRPGRIIKAGTASDGNTAVRPSSAAAYTLDMTAPSPTWQATGSMAYPRAFLNLTPLPDGTVLATGGESTADGTHLANAVYAAEVWSPATGRWSTLGSASRPRFYHSVAMLLPDGRVLVGGGGNDGAVPTELSYEIFSPPYLFKGQRPTIALAPGTVGYGQAFGISTPDASRIASVVLLAPSAVTHAFDENAHYVPLSFSLNGNALQVQSPASANLASPGHYMLFIVDTNGVPSAASWLRVVTGTPDTTAPSAPGTLAASGGVGGASLTWAPATDNVGVTAYNVHRSTTSGFTVSSTNRIGQSASTSYNDTGLGAGTYYYRVTASDAAGNTGPPSNEASTIVTGGSGGITLEASLSTDVLDTATLSGISTAAPNDLLLAFVAADGPGSAVQAASVSGGGLAWTLVRRTNTQLGTAEVWQATAASPLVNATVQSVLTRTGYRQSLTLVVLSGVAGVSATAGAAAPSGAPSVSLTATAAGSWVFGVGNDYSNAVARTLGAGQTMIHQWVETTLGDTYWVQRLASPVTAAGSVATVFDTGPTTDRWNLTAVEVVPR